MDHPEERGTVWITGARGLIGNYLTATAPARVPRFRVVPLSHESLELTDFEAVEKKFRADKPVLVVHCAALSRTSDCQSDPGRARKNNVEVTAHLAGLAAESDFIFFSTDMVFDGRKGGYVETDPVNPLSVYGETKAEAERVVLGNPRHTVLRTSLNGGISPKGGRAFNEELECAWRAGRTVNLFYDEYRCPIPAVVTARVVWDLAGLRRPGLYHLCGSERLSRVDIGRLISARHTELNPRWESCSLRNYNGPPRAADLSMSNATLQRLLAFTLPGLTEWLKEHDWSG